MPRVTASRDPLPGTVLPPGWTVRHVVPADRDFDLAVDVCVRCELAALGWSEHSRGETVDLLTSPDTDAEGCLLVLGPDGRAAGFIAVEADHAARSVFLDAYADPGYPGVPATLWSSLVASGTARAEQIAAAAGGDWIANTGSYQQDVPYTEAIVEHGYQPVRHFIRMSIGTDDPRVPATAPEPPPGVTLEVATSEEARGQLHEVFEAAFVDHFDHTPRSTQEWLARVGGAEHADPDRWWLARVDGVPAAVCLLDDSRLEWGDGYVRTLAVVREFRGRGLARWLLQRAFVDSRERGLARVTLSVDAESPTGADALYRSVGMLPIATVVLRRRAV